MLLSMIGCKKREPTLEEVIGGDRKLIETRLDNIRYAGKVASMTSGYGYADGYLAKSRRSSTPESRAKMRATPGEVPMRVFQLAQADDTDRPGLDFRIGKENATLMNVSDAVSLGDPSSVARGCLADVASALAGKLKLDSHTYSDKISRTDLEGCIADVKRFEYVVMVSSDGRTDATQTGHDSFRGGDARATVQVFRVSGTEPVQLGAPMNVLATSSATVTAGAGSLQSDLSGNVSSAIDETLRKEFPGSKFRSGD